MQRTAGLIATALLAAAGWLLLLPAAPVAQPMEFNHARHGGLGCTTCHRGAGVAARAELPAIAVCAKCHATLPGGADATRWEALQQTGLAWVRVTNLPSHVMFSHRRHVTLARLECASCHADIGRGTAPPSRAPVRLEMSTCLGCHTREGASEDCAACHR